MNNDIVDVNRIEDLIYEINGRQVMLDSDLAKLYKCKNGTKEINQAVKNNPNKFPDRYAFRISEQDYNTLKSKVLTSKGGSRKGHIVFTEQGVYMLATILKTNVATEISIRIMDTFSFMRKYIENNLINQMYYNDMTIRNNVEIRKLQEVFKKFNDEKKKSEIYFNGQIYDAYSKILDIFKSAYKELIIIDAYADKNVLDIIRKLDVNVILIVKKCSLLSKKDIEKYKEQYKNLNVIYNDDYHDRYFIIDNTIVYHCGASINRIGYKTFSITLVDDEIIRNSLINKIKEIL